MKLTLLLPAIKPVLEDLREPNDDQIEGLLWESLRRMPALHPERRTLLDIRRRLARRRRARAAR